MVQLDFVYLPGFANYLLTHRLTEFSLVLSDLLRSQDMPLLQAYENLDEEQRVKISIDSNKKMLSRIAENRVSAFIHESVEEWENNEIPQITKNEIDAADISILSYARKTAFRSFLNEYDPSHGQFSEIMEEVDRFCMAIDTALIRQQATIQNRLFQQAQSMAKIGNWVWNVQTGKIIWSAEMFSIYEVPQTSDISVRLIESMMHPEDWNRADSLLETLLLRGTIADYYYRIITGSGKTKVLHMLASAIRTEGKSEYLTGTVQDVTQQKSIENSLFEQQNLVQKIADVSPTIIAVYSIENKKTVFINKKVESLLGYSSEEILGSDLDQLRSIVHPDDLEGFILNMRRLFQPMETERPVSDRKVSEISVRLRHKNGDYKPFCNYLTVFSRKDGIVTEILNILVDNSNEVELRRGLIEEKNFAELLTEMSMHSIIAVDCNYNVKVWNGEAEKKFKKNKESILHSPLFSVLDEENHFELKEFLAEALAGRDGYREKQRFYFDEEAWAQLHYCPVKDEGGHIIGAVVFISDISRQVEATAELKKLNYSFLQAEKISQIGHWYWNLKTRHIHYSDNLYNLLGCDPSEFQPGLDNFVNFVHPEDRHLFSDLRESLLSEKAVKPFLYRIFKKDGTVRYLNYHSKIVPLNPDEKIVIGITQDITDHHLLKEQLNDQNKKLALRTNFVQLLLDSSIDMTAAVDTNMQIIEWNKKCEQIIHLKKADVLGKNIEDIFPMLSNTTFIKGIYKALKGKTVRARYPKGFMGARRFLEIYYTPIVTKNKAVAGVVIVVHDLTEISEKNRELNQLLKTLEEKNLHIRENEERYHRLIEDIEDYAIFGMDANGYIVSWNKGAQKIKGYTSEEITGKHYSMFFTENDLKKNMPHRLLQMAKKKGKVSVEGWRVKKNGSVFWGNMTLTALRDENNNITGFSKITRDITQRKISNDKLKLFARQLEEKNVELEKINKELESFSYVASHDLQEPLRKIQAFSNLILEKEKDNFSESTHNYFNKMNLAAARMQQLINDLLEFSRLSSSVEFRVIDLNILLKEVLSNLKISIDESRAVIKSGKLPMAAVIPFQFKQMLQNLIGNSIKYRKEGRNPVIHITHRMVNGESLKDFGAIRVIRYLKISIRDNGIGFDQKYASKIFELFQRLHGKDEYKGTGIGLAICKKIIQNHNGFIVAVGEEGKGATFEVYIPEKIIE